MASSGKQGGRAMGARYVEHILRQRKGPGTPQEPAICPGCLLMTFKFPQIQNESVSYSNAGVHLSFATRLP